MNVNQVDILGNTQIMHSILDDKADNDVKINTITLLIKYGANLDIKNKDGKTALMLASELNNYEIVELLLSHGAKPNIGGLKTTTKLSTEKMGLLRKFNETYELYPEKLTEELENLKQYFEKFDNIKASLIETALKAKNIEKRLSEITETNYKEFNDELSNLTNKFNTDFELLKTHYEEESRQVEKSCKQMNEILNGYKLLIDKFKPTDGKRKKSGKRSRKKRRSLKRRSKRKSRSRKNK